MQQLRFPTERVEWVNFVERLLSELRVDYSRLWQVLPQLPDPEAGIPYTGPLSPAPYCWPFQACARNIEPCEEDCYLLTVASSRPEVSGTGGCQDCHLLDGTFEVNRTSGASGAARCDWYGDCIHLDCGSTWVKYHLFYVRATGKWTLALEGYTANCAAVASTAAQWTYNGTPGGTQAFPITLNTAGGSATQVIFTVGGDGSKVCNLSSNVTVDVCP